MNAFLWISSVLTALLGSNPKTWEILIHLRNQIKIGLRLQKFRAMIVRLLVCSNIHLNAGPNSTQSFTPAAFPGYFSAFRSIKAGIDSSSKN